MTTLVTSKRFLKSNVRSGVTKRLRAIEARLHTATSSGEVYSIISVHRLLHLMVPRFCRQIMHNYVCTCTYNYTNVGYSVQLQHKLIHTQIVAN